MAKLIKSMYIDYKPADPGSPGHPGVPARPGYWTSCTTTGGWTTSPNAGVTTITTYTPVFGPCSSTESLTVGASCVVGFTPSTSTAAQISGYNAPCVPTWVPPTAEIPPVPPVPPSPAQLSQNFNEGWNTSAQSIASLIPGKAAQFKIASGARGVLMGLAPEPWTPRVNTLLSGIMFHDGKADIYENGAFIGQPLGNFYAGQEFIIGRTSDNYLVFLNRTDSKIVTRRKSPAAPSQPVHLFALLYYGGDTVLI